ncbi:MAG: NAD-dependent epimerase/dehydratase family protein [Bacteroidales bacterium]|nr:NAD-dependent epimerase/dehydratase family protein [Candidatus Colimorpha onthohippi]
MRVLVLGASGLLGHNVLKQLIVQGHEVAVLLRRKNSLQLDEADRVSQIVEPIWDITVLRQAMIGCDAIINCAGITDMSLLRYTDYLPVNRNLPAMLVSLMETLGVSVLVHVSTANTIGYGTLESPASESNVMQEPFLNSFYARSKEEGEHMLISAARHHPDWHVVIVNPGFMIGPFDVKPSSGALLLFGYRHRLVAVPKGGKSFVAVEAVASAVVNALVRGTNGQRYLATGENLSFKELFCLQAKVCGYRQKIVLLPKWICRLGGLVGDLLRYFHVATSVSTDNVNQLLITEYYDNKQSLSELQMPDISIAQAIQSFHAWRDR